MADIKSKVLKQVEFYFSDSNFPRDRFLKDLANQHDGWVPIETIEKFKRMRDLTDKHDVIVSAIRESPALLEVSEDGKMVKRRIEIPDDVDASKRTLFVKPLEESMTLDQLTEFFEQSFPVASIRMRRTPETRAFKGSVFVEFKTEEDAQAYMATERLNPQGKPLTVMLKAAYIAQKNDEYAERKKTLEERAAAASSGGASSSTAAATVSAPAPDDCVVKIENLSGEEVSREVLKDLFGEYGKIQFVEYSRGEPSGYVRYATGGGAAAAVAALSAKGLTYNGQTPKFTALTGTENADYFVKVAEEQRKRKQPSGKRGKKPAPKGARPNKRAKVDHGDE